MSYLVRMANGSSHIIRVATSGELEHAFAIDDAALAVYAAAGLVISLADEHPFVRAERESWRRALEGQGVYFAIVGGVRAGFYVTAVRTRPEGGHNGVSFLLIDAGDGVTAVFSEMGGVREG